jgi:hypothetical protein
MGAALCWQQQQLLLPLMVLLGWLPAKWLTAPPAATTRQAVH